MSALPVLPQPDARRLPDYAEVRDRVLRKFADDTRQRNTPESVADAVAAAVVARTPKLRYPVGAARSLSLLRRFIPSGMFEKTFRRQRLLEI